jgi:hypothetical protein
MGLGCLHAVSAAARLRHTVFQSNAELQTSGGVVRIRQTAMVHLNLPGPPVQFTDRVQALRFGALSSAMLASIGGGFLGFALGGIAGVLLEPCGLGDSQRYVAVAVASGVGALGGYLAAENWSAWKGSLLCWAFGSLLGCVLIYLTDNRQFTPGRGVYEISLALTGGMTALLLAVPRGARAFARRGFTEGDSNSRKLLVLSELAALLAVAFGPARARVSFFLAAAIGARLPSRSGDWLRPAVLPVRPPFAGAGQLRRIESAKGKGTAVPRP